MFYYPNVLQRHTGCFSTIWLAATKGIRISRRDYLKVNVRRTCEDIVDYVMVQVPPVHPSLPRPRFSLYLSSQLQYGVVIVYHRQCAFLLEEVQQTIERLLRSKRHLNIDMPDTDRLVLNVPDTLFQLEEAEWALEPFFGVMGVDCGPPSPYLSSQFIEGSSPLVARKEITSPKGLVASSESITIKDAELVPVLAAEFGGAELPEATAQEIDMLMEQQDQFHLDEEDKERERATEVEKSGDLDPGMVSIEQLKNSECIVEEGNGRPTEVTLDRVAMEMTPPPITMPPTTEASERDVAMERSSETLLVEQSVPPKRRGRKRQLIFADQITQISQDAMRQQINNPLIETQSLSDTLLSIPASRKSSAAVLLGTPCNLLIHPDLQALWKCCSVFSALPHPSRKRRVQEESELWEMEKERGTERIAHLSQSDLITPTSRCLRWMSSPLPNFSGSLRNLVSEHVFVCITVWCDPNIHQIFFQSFFLSYRLINSFIKRFGKVCFHSLLPPEPERSTAAHLFYKILELLCSLKLSARQTEAFGVITLTMNR
uniref:REC8 meiotic recombination protein b n=1 Tax=Cyprinus carpio TaxID=7962 RepID=A0A8C2IUH1_CYPCA